MNLGTLNERKSCLGMGANCRACIGSRQSHLNACACFQISDNTEALAPSLVLKKIGLEQTSSLRKLMDANTMIWL